MCSCDCVLRHHDCHRSVTATVQPPCSPPREPFPSPRTRPAAAATPTEAPSPSPPASTAAPPPTKPAVSSGPGGRPHQQHHPHLHGIHPVLVLVDERRALTPAQPRPGVLRRAPPPPLPRAVRGHGRRRDHRGLRRRRVCRVHRRARADRLRGGAARDRRRSGAQRASSPTPPSSSGTPTTATGSASPTTTASASCHRWTPTGVGRHAAPAHAVPRRPGRRTSAPALRPVPRHPPRPPTRVPGTPRSPREPGHRVPAVGTGLAPPVSSRRPVDARPPSGSRASRSRCC